MTFFEQPSLRLLKVPPEPDPPTGAPESLRVFRAAEGYLNYRRLVWLFRQGSAFAGVLAFFYFDARYGFENFLAGVPVLLLPLIRLIETFAVTALVVQAPVTLALTHLDYRYRWYMTTDRSLRIREGVANMRERTMTFSNIQNVSIRQGPIQRLFGISDLEVRSAGGSGGEKADDPTQKKEDLHLGYFRGVSNAAEIRDVIMESLRRVKGAGLGDPDEPAAHARDVDAVSAARLLLDEAQALRRSVA